ISLMWSKVFSQCAKRSGGYEKEDASFPRLACPAPFCLGPPFSCARQLRSADCHELSISFLDQNGRRAELLARPPVLPPYAAAASSGPSGKEKKGGRKSACL